MRSESGIQGPASRELPRPTVVHKAVNSDNFSNKHPFTLILARPEAKYAIADIHPALAVPIHVSSSIKYTPPSCYASADHFRLDPLPRSQSIARTTTLSGSHDFILQDCGKEQEHILTAARRTCSHVERQRRCPQLARHV